jgi:hypothetical protein
VDEEGEVAEAVRDLMQADGEGGDPADAAADGEGRGDADAVDEAVGDAAEEEGGGAGGVVVVVVGVWVGFGFGVWRCFRIWLRFWIWLRGNAGEELEGALEGVEAEEGEQEGKPDGGAVAEGLDGFREQVGDAGGEQDADGEADEEGKRAAEEGFKPVEGEDGCGGEGLHGEDGEKGFEEHRFEHQCAGAGWLPEGFLAPGSPAGRV